MREILFRGKRTANGEWVEGYLFCNLNLMSDFYGYIREKNGGDHEVLLNTVSEFTGLFDKNGKRIFEGDIVKAEVGLDTYKGIVKYDEECAMFLVEAFERDKKEHSDKLRLGCEFITEVIGNKWDNPELLAER